MFEIPGTNVASVHITEDYVKGVTKQPVYVYKKSTDSTTPTSSTNSSNNDEEGDKNQIRIQQSV